jgi:hypothetical protein
MANSQVKAATTLILNIEYAAILLFERSLAEESSCEAI